ncbi:MAG: alpha/beta fold hydrolase, partial [Candidatus Puniceispirillaceae bacterium]
IVGGGFAPYLQQATFGVGLKGVELGEAQVAAVEELVLGTLRRLAVPALVLCGSLDTLTPPDISREMAALAPQAELVILEDVGHLSTMEAPGRVTAHLNAFLARCGDRV